MLHPRTPLALVRPRLTAWGLAVALVCGAGMVSVAHAQEDPEAGDLLAPDGDGLLETGLKAREKAPAPVLDDPDPKLLEEVEARRAAFEGTLNKLATASNQFAEIDKVVNGLTSQGLKAMDAYMETHRQALEGYRAAVAEDHAANKKKFGEEVLKIRKKYLGEIAKVQKGADKLKEKADKLQAKIDSGKAVLAEEGAEEGAEAGKAGDAKGEAKE